MNLQEYFSALRDQGASRPPLFRAHLFFSPLPGPSVLPEVDSAIRVIFFYETSKLNGPQKDESKKLFHRMIEAMGLNPKYYSIVEFSKGESENPQFLEKLWKKNAPFFPCFYPCFWCPRHESSP